jgi:phosphoribosylanthranilate isomerase
VIVKICGITALEDGLAALDAGADMLGFNFYRASPRFVTPDACAALVSTLRREGAPFRSAFVNHPPGEVVQIMARCELDLAQLSGDEPPEALAAIGAGRAFKAIRATGMSAAEHARRYAVRSSATRPALLLDAAAGAGHYGGTGLSADRSTARVLAGAYALLLAGGLRDDNVADAVRQVRPWGVDVASGVESSPGRKDPAQCAPSSLRGTRSRSLQRGRKRARMNADEEGIARYEREPMITDSAAGPGDRHLPPFDTGPVRAGDPHAGPGRVGGGLPHTAR